LDLQIFKFKKMKKQGLPQNSGNFRSPPNYSRKYENLLSQPDSFNQSPIGYNAAANDYSSVKYYDPNSGDKENCDILKKVKHLKAKYQNSTSGNNDSGVINRNSRDIANNTNRPVQNYLIIGNKNNNAKIGKPSVDKPRLLIESKKMGKIKKLYGKSKSPGEMSQKFMNPSSNLFN
jgi:hypothetical protein